MYIYKAVPFPRIGYPVEIVNPWAILVTSACLINGSGLVVEPEEGEVGQVAQALQYSSLLITGRPLGSDQGDQRGVAPAEF